MQATVVAAAVAVAIAIAIADADADVAGLGACAGVAAGRARVAGPAGSGFRPLRWGSVWQTC